MRFTHLLISAVIALAAAGAAFGQHDDSGLQDRLRAHVEFLADDLMLGRQPGTPQYDIAARYVSSQMRQIGLQPAGDDGGYLQNVPLRRAWSDTDSTRFSLVRDDANRDFVFVEEYFIGPSLTHEAADLEAEMVFVGYGIDAPELGYSDYTDVDVDGRIAVMIGGQPHDFPSEEGAHFASGREKIRAATEAGAIGMVSIYTPRNEKRYAWDRLSTRVGMPSMGWLTEQGEVFASPRQIRAGGVIHYTPAAALFDGAEAPLEEVLRRDQDAEAVGAFALNGRLKLAQRSRHETITSPNVAGYLPGADPLLSDEYVVYTAHLDHIGELPGDGHQDHINNGALDNATGVSVMLETARLFAEREAPRRSVLFVAVTAEEKGLVGSEYFAQNPTVPEGSMVGVINLDMPMLLYDFGDVIAFGASHSSLGATVQQAADEAGVGLTPDPYPEQNIFVRSDHYRFVQKGIPSIFLVTGITDTDGQNTMDLAMSFRQEHYHRPSDDVALPIDYAAGARFTRINTRIGEIVANKAERPGWHEGDFFGETFSP